MSKTPSGQQPVIRAAQTAAERRAALALLEAEWPAETDWFRLELTDPRSNPAHFLVALAGDSVVGHVQVTGPRHMQYGRAWLTAGGLHGLVVAPAWRRRGLGRRLVACAHALLHNVGATVSIAFAPVPAFYARLGYGRTFPLYSTVIAAEAAARAAAPFTVRAGQPADVATVAAAYTTMNVPGAVGPFERTESDWHWLLATLSQTDRSRLRPFFGRERQLLIRADDKSPVPGYAWTGTSNSRLWVFESACRRDEAARWLATLGVRALIRGQREIAITAPPAHPLAAAAYAHGGANIHRQGTGMACILHFSAFLAQIEAELDARLGVAPAWPCPVEGSVLGDGLVAPMCAVLPGPAARQSTTSAEPVRFAASPAFWARLLFGQIDGTDPDHASVPPLLRLLFPPGTPHIWPVDNRF